jgi:catechol 2,3-dioxygenase-like lactoylglutathione lyase family enzyme
VYEAHISPPRGIGTGYNQVQKAGDRDHFNIHYPRELEEEMIKVRRLGHATISTPDIQGQTDYYSRILGFNVLERSKDRVFFATKQGIEAIELVSGAANGLQRISFQIAPSADLGDVVRQLKELGIAAERRKDVSPGVSEAVSFIDPRGTAVDLYSKYKFAPLNDNPSPINIVKLGHVAYGVTDLEKASKFYCDVFGFRVSDWRGDYFVFLRCNTDHHTINFITTAKPELVHIAFEVLDWSELHRANDYLARNKIHLVWGPGRHIIGHNIAAYHRNADLVRVEIFTEMDQMKDEELGYFDPRPWHQEFPLYPKTHGPETLRNFWGYGSERIIPGYQTNEMPKYGAIYN